MTHAELIEIELRIGPATAAELTATTGLDRHQVSHAIDALRRRGRLHSRPFLETNPLSGTTYRAALYTLIEQRTAA